MEWPYSKRLRFFARLHRRFLLVSVTVRPWRRSSQEKLAAVRERDRLTDGFIGSVLGLKTFYYHLTALGQSRFSEAEAKQAIRAPAFDHPAHHVSAGIFHI